MGLYIKGMEMPTSCEYCPLCRWLTSTTYCYASKATCQFNDSRPNLCPLIEVPPHGRLIDADDIEHISIEWELGDIARIDAPTVIPAEEDKECK